MKSIGDRLTRFHLKGSMVIQLLTIGGSLCLFGASQNASATNYFNWGVESNATSVPSLPVTAYRGNSVRTTETAHTGSYSMKSVVIGNDDNNQSLGAEVGQQTLPFNIVGSPSIYYRYWLKIMPGFSWGTLSTGHHSAKQIRVLGPNDAKAYSVYIAASGFVMEECDPGCESGSSPASIDYDMTTKDDGQWHEYIMRIKPNSTITTYDAEIQAWVDGVSVGQVTGWILHKTAGTAFVQAWGSAMVTHYFQLGSTASDGGTIYLDDFSMDDTYNSLIGGTPTLSPPSNLEVQ